MTALLRTNKEHLYRDQGPGKAGCPMSRLCQMSPASSYCQLSYSLPPTQRCFYCFVDLIIPFHIPRISKRRNIQDYYLEIFFSIHSTENRATKHFLLNGLLIMLWLALWTMLVFAKPLLCGMLREPLLCLTASLAVASSEKPVLSACNKQGRGEIWGHLEPFKHQPAPILVIISVGVLSCVTVTAITVHSNKRRSLVFSSQGLDKRGLTNYRPSWPLLRYSDTNNLTALSWYCHTKICSICNGHSFLSEHKKVSSKCSGSDLLMSHFEDCEPPQPRLELLPFAGAKTCWWRLVLSLSRRGL